MDSMNILGLYVYLLQIFSCFNANLFMQIERGVYLGHYGILSLSFPSIYQCAELCLGIDECLSVTFDNRLKVCKLNNRDWAVNDLSTGPDFLYASKSKMPKNLVTSCANNIPGDQSFCIESSFGHTSIPFYACTNALVDDDFCVKRAGMGTCLQSNIGQNLSTSYHLTQNGWSWYQTQCKRSCKLCP